MKYSTDSGVSEETLMKGLAELAAKSIHRADFEDPDDKSMAGGEIFLYSLKKIVENPSFKKMVKNIFAEYNEELFLDGLDHPSAP